MTICPLNELSKNQPAFVQEIGKVPENLRISQEEFERRLLEMGLDAGTPITLLHKGPFKGPVAVRIRNCYTIALSRNEAQVISCLV